MRMIARVALVGMGPDRRGGRQGPRRPRRDRSARRRRSGARQGGNPARALFSTGPGGSHRAASAPARSTPGQRRPAANATSSFSAPARGSIRCCPRSRRRSRAGLHVVSTCEELAFPELRHGTSPAARREGQGEGRRGARHGREPRARDGSPRARGRLRLCSGREDEASRASWTPPSGGGRSGPRSAPDCPGEEFEPASPRRSSATSASRSPPR